jgi:predicted flap endonuclease-1-like 5' DNA nuclease
MEFKMKLSEIKGIGEERARNLISAGVHNVEQLLEMGGTADGRKQLAEKMNEMSQKTVLEWVNRADLIRVKGVSTHYSNLLEASGVDTVKELAQRNAANLHAKLAEVNAKLGLVKRVPRLSDVEKWVEQAKELPRKIYH